MMYKKIKHYAFRIIEEFCKKNRIIHLYYSAVGLKNINMGYVADLGKIDASNKVLINAEELFLGPDFLKDKYTLLGTRITESPHYEFMKTLKQNEDFRKTEYIIRWENGTLDWRRAMPMEIYQNEWKLKFRERLKEIQNDSYKPIKIYKVGGKKYIYDGKHRAAVCALLNKKIQCEIISNNCIFSYYNRYMFNCIINKPEYSIHRKMFELHEKET